jgi:VanZ family protein
MRNILYFLLIGLWIGFIFYNSSNINEVSQKISQRVAQVLEYSLPEFKVKESSVKEIEERKQKLNYFVRKNAHAFEYLVLAVLSSLLFSQCNKQFRRTVVRIIVLCLLVASADEYYQGFVRGRNSSLLDVIIDTIGSILGIIVIVFKESIKKTKVDMFKL